VGDKGCGVVQLPQILTISNPGLAYMSNVTLQGDGQPGRGDATQAMFIPDVSSKVFAEGECALPAFH
jgi:hypothetical protein